MKPKRAKQIGALVTLLGVVWLVVLSGATTALATATPAPTSYGSSAVSGVNGSTTNSITIPAIQGDVLLLWFSSNPNGGIAQPTSVTAGTSAMTLRGDYIDNVANGLSTWEYWSVAQSNGPVTMTVTMSAATVTTMTAYSVSGANAASPFDSAFATPSFSGIKNCNPSCSQGFFTNGPDALVIAVFTSTGNPTITPASPFTVGPAASNAYMATQSATAVYATPGSQTAGFSLSVGENYVVALDAIAPPPTQTTTNSTLSTASSASVASSSTMTTTSTGTTTLTTTVTGTTVVTTGVTTISTTVITTVITTTATNHEPGFNTSRLGSPSYWIDLAPGFLLLIAGVAIAKRKV